MLVLLELQRLMQMLSLYFMAATSCTHLYNVQAVGFSIIVLEMCAIHCVKLLKAVYVLGSLSICSCVYVCACVFVPPWTLL